jgi:pimeloyl-ACP methyl ester carboxylesterase
MIDQGRGAPVVVIPGLQGRWEWMLPTIRALAARYRVLSYSLGDDPFDLAEMDCLLDEARVERAAVVGVSFGGLVAVHYAAHRPDRVAAVVLVSAPAPAMRLDPTSRFFMRHPVLSFPAFVARAVLRLGPEILASPMGWAARFRFGLEHAGRVVRWPLLPRQMVRWVEAWQNIDIRAACGRVRAPALIVTGEPHLDRVVPVASTTEYLTLLPGSRHVILPRSGHVGLISRPADFVGLVAGFLDRHSEEREAAAAPAAAGRPG